MLLCPGDARVLPPAPQALCRSPDFTWAFHLVVLQLLPSAVYGLVSLVVSSRYLAASSSPAPKHLDRRAGSSWRRNLKLVAPATLLAIAALRFILFAAPAPLRHLLAPISRLVLAANAVRVVAAAALLVQTWIDLARQSRPTTINVLYLTLMVLFDAALVRTMSLTADHLVASGAFAATVVGLIAELVCLTTECLFKRHQLVWSLDQHQSRLACLAADGSSDQGSEDVHGAVGRDGGSGGGDDDVELVDAIRSNPSRALTASVLSRAAHTWLLPTMWTGRTTKLTIDSLEETDDAYTVQSDLTRFEQCWDRYRLQRDPSPHALAWAILASFRYALLRPVMPKLLFIAVSFAQPFLVSRTTSYLQSTERLDGRRAEPSYHGWGLVGAYTLVYALIGLLTAYYQSTVDEAACRIRRTLVSVIYQKSLRLRQDAAVESGAGGATTLISADMERLCNGLVLVHEVWASILQVAIALWLAEVQISYAFLVPVVTTVISIVLTGWISNRMRAVVVAWTRAMQTRVKLVTSVMHSARPLKLSSRLAPLSQRLEALRALELAAFRAAMWIATTLVVAANDLENYTTLFTLIAYSAIAQRQHGGGTLDTSKLFTVVSVLTLLRNPLFLLAQYAPMLLAALGASIGIRDFLLKPELEADPRPRSPSSSSAASDTAAAAEPLALVAERLTLYAGADLLVEEATFAVPRYSLTCITGPTGSGKTLMLNAFLREVSFVADRLVLDRKRGVAYCAQNAWLRDSSIRDNILFHSAYDKRRYADVLWCLDLAPDIAAMAEGDETRVGSNGSKLSGGQKSRVALARALYSRSPLLLLDDPLAALDASTVSKVTSRLLSEAAMRDPTSPGRRLLAGRTVILACHEAPLDATPDRELVLRPIKAHGSGPRSSCEMVAASQRSVPLYSPTADAVADADTAAAAASLPPSWQPTTEGRAASVSASAPAAAAELGGSAKLDPWAAFKFYCRTCGLVRTSIYTAFAVLAATSLAAINIYLYFWSAANDRSANANLWAWIGGYAAVVTVNSLALTGQVYYLFVPVAQACARRMHRLILGSTLASPLSYFLEHSSGAIVNRFSQDLFVSDNDMTKALFNVSSNLGVVLGSVILLSLASPYFLLILPLLLPTLWAVKTFYLRTSGQVRRLDLESKSPLYTLYGETIEGIVTIRAFCGQAAFARLNETLLSRSQRAFYLNLSLMRWINLVSSLIVAAIAAAFCSLSVGLAQRALDQSGGRGAASSTVGWVAVGLTQLMSLAGAITMLAKAWTQLELCLVAIERLQQVVGLPREHDIDDRPLELEAPATVGLSLEVEAVSVVYSAAATPSPAGSDAEKAKCKGDAEAVAVAVLRDLSFSLAPGEKCAVLGRTGSGKSTLILALLRFVDVSSGSIRLGGAPIASMSLRQLRSRVVVMPQETVILAGCTVRDNLAMLVDDDSLRVADDEQLWASLERVGLHGHFAKSAEGLDSQLDAADLSAGQRQLLALAQLDVACRSALRRGAGKLVILDEPTSHLDGHGDALLADMLADAESLGGLTVVIVSHRFGPVRRCDKALVLTKATGETQGAAEFGRPRELFERRGSVFGALARDAGALGW
ncbi:hypothetical protein ACQY0O_006056 [Thecaphora frezii]